MVQRANVLSRELLELCVSLLGEVMLEIGVYVPCMVDTRCERFFLDCGVDQAESPDECLDVVVILKVTGASMNLLLKTFLQQKDSLSIDQRNISRIVRLQPDRTRTLGTII